MTIIRFFLSENFQFFGGEILYIFEYACFHNDQNICLESKDSYETCAGWSEYAHFGHIQRHFFS